jgi:protease stability complex PrcB-like protein
MGSNGLRVLVAVALAASVVAWLGYARLWARGGGEPLAWRDRSADLSRAQLARPTYEVFRDRGAFAHFLQLHADAAVSVPRIDFRRELAVLLALGPRSSTGYRIDVGSVTKERGRVVIVAREHSPQLGQAVAPRVEYPLKLLVLHDAGKPIALEWVG